MKRPWEDVPQGSAEINVAPLVDVMLVLLVIFMVTAPMMFSGVPLELPKTGKADSVQLDSDKVVLSITRQGELFLGKKATTVDRLAKDLNKRFKGQPKQVFVRADEGLKYGLVARVLALLKASGVTGISLISQEQR